MVIAHSKSKMHWKMALLLFFIILSRDWEREQRELFKVCHCHICLLFRSIWTTRSSCNRVVFLTWQGTKWKGEIQKKIPPHPKLYNCSFFGNLKFISTFINCFQRVAFGISWENEAKSRWNTAKLPTKVLKSKRGEEEPEIDRSRRQFGCCGNFLGSSFLFFADFEL